MNKQLLWIIVIISILIIIVYQENKTKSQTLIPQCFEKEDCRVSIRKGYCDIKYDCIQGRCYNSNVLCPEICDSKVDDDLDGYTDCKDNDCWSNSLCSCSNMNFNDCAVGRCYCPLGKKPRWHVDISKYCACV